MSDYVRIYVPTEMLDAGDQIVLYGPDGEGGVDLDAPIARRSAVAAAQGGHYPVGVPTGPPELSPSGQERAAAALRVGPVGPGVQRFAARVYRGADDAAAGGTPGEFSLFVNAAPRNPRGVTSAAALVGGQVRVTFTESEDL